MKAELECSDPEESLWVFRAVCEQNEAVELQAWCDERAIDMYAFPSGWMNTAKLVVNVLVKNADHAFEFRMRWT